MKAINVIYGPEIADNAFIVMAPMTDCAVKIHDILRDDEGNEYPIIGADIKPSEDGNVSLMLMGKPKREKTVLYA